MKKTRKLVYSAFFAALICAATYIHIPAGSGYIHPADGVLITGAYLLGPVWGGFAAAIGSALADIFSGYFLYAPATFIIKGFMPVAVFIIYKKTQSKFFIFTASAIAEIIMILGYFGFELIFYREYALINISANLIQGVAGIVISVLLYSIISKNKNFFK